MKSVARARDASAANDSLLLPPVIVDLILVFVTVVVDVFPPGFLVTPCHRMSHVTIVLADRYSRTHREVANEGHVGHHPHISHEGERHEDRKDDEERNHQGEQNRRQK